MATITFPSSPKPSGMAWRLVMPSQVNVSPYTGARQVVSSNRGWWECTMSLPPIVTTASIKPWRSFIAKSRGSANNFQVPVDPTAQSSLSETPQVDGANQIGRTLNTDGWPASTTCLSAGDFITIGNQLLQLTEDITSDSSGDASISFEPAIRTSPADDASIEFKNPFALMYLTEEPVLDVSSGEIYSLSLSLRESF